MTIEQVWHEIEPCSPPPPHVFALFWPHNRRNHFICLLIRLYSLRPTCGYVFRGD